MSNPRIEEVSDDDEDINIDDPDEMDLDAFDFARPQHRTLESDAAASQIDPETLQSILQPQSSSSSGQASAGASQQIPGVPAMTDKERARLEAEQRERSKNFQCIYPVYFDSTRSRADGRRVKKEDAVPNPLAREIVDALQGIMQREGVGLQVVFEPTKTHPKDWANPGRVRVLVKEDGDAINAKVVKNKHHLYKQISTHLKTHPTTEDSPLRLRLQGLPPPKDGKAPTPAIPRGFKMGSVLPLHSPAISGGGVSENFLQDMMAEMGDQMPESMRGMANMANMAGGAGGQKKPKMMRVRAK